MAGLELNTMTWLTVQAGQEILALIESWKGQVIGIEGEHLETVRDVNDVAKAGLSDKWTNIRQQVKERGVKGLAVFARDVADRATMNKSVEAQADLKVDSNSQISEQKDDERRVRSMGNTRFPNLKAKLRHEATNATKATETAKTAKTGEIEIEEHKD